ncbi:rRNA maturation RNase YbeY [Methyloglobulus sp.]|jgi:probable rRNA maturation factor|uniref:rRNA maturation RNase YbeY n=1 Tax=Methyloglobulus sp. TaxID=2518622 RepID=UPI0032B703CE
MNQIEVQVVFSSPGQPDKAQIQQWVDAALQGYDKDAEIVVRIVDVHESAQLNKQYRHKPGPTNILSFPVEVPEGIELNLLGDLVVCAPVVEREAIEQQKLLTHHWAHIIIHGVLHLLGYDHIEEDEAEVMESLEIKILQALNISNPYLQAHEL